MKEKLQNQAKNLSDQKITLATSMRSTGHNDRDLKAYFQILLMSEVTDAALRLLDSGIVMMFFDKEFSEVDVQRDNNITNIFDSTRIDFEEKKGIVLSAYYCLVVFCALVSLHLLFHVVVAIVTAQLTMYTIVYGLLGMNALRNTSRFFKQIGQLEKDFSLLEQAQKETQPHEAFFARYGNAAGGTIVCTQSAYQLAKGFYSQDSNDHSVAANEDLGLTGSLQSRK